MRNLLIAALMFILTISAIAQKKEKNDDKTLTHGIQFQIGNDFTLDGYDYLNFAYRYLLSESTGLRFGISTDVKGRVQDEKRYQDTLYNASENNEDWINIKIVSHFLVNLLQRNDFKLIVGGGPFLNYANFDSKTKRTFPETPPYRSDDERIVYGGGVELIGGVEYNLAKNVVLSAEYITTVNYFYQKQTAERINEDNGRVVENKTVTKTDAFNIDYDSVRLGISVFF